MQAGQKRLGDYVKMVTNAAGIETCESCEKRRQALNALHIKIEKAIKGKDIADDRATKAS